MLYGTALRLQRTDLSGPEASEIIEPLRQVLLFFDDHADHEDRFILPHIRKHSRSSSTNWKENTRLITA